VLRFSLKSTPKKEKGVPFPSPFPANGPFLAWPAKIIRRKRPFFSPLMTLPLAQGLELNVVVCLQDYPREGSKRMRESTFFPFSTSACLKGL